MVKYLRNETSIFESNNELSLVQSQISSPETRTQGVIRLAQWIDTIDPDQCSKAVLANGKQWLLAIYNAMEQKAERRKIAGPCLFCVFSITNIVKECKLNQESVFNIRKLLNEKCILRAAHLSLEMLAGKNTAHQRMASLFLEQTLLTSSDALVVMRNAIWDTLFDLLSKCRNDAFAKTCCNLLALSATLGNNAAMKAKNWNSRYESTLQKCSVALNFYFSDVDVIPIPVNEDEPCHVDGSLLDLKTCTFYLHNMILLLKAMISVPKISCEVSVDKLIRVVIGGLHPLTKLGMRKQCMGSSYFMVERALLELCSAVMIRFGISICRFSDELNKILLLLLRTTEEYDRRVDNIFSVMLVWVTCRGMLSGIERNGCAMHIVRMAIEKLMCSNQRRDDSVIVKFLSTLIDTYLERLPNACVEELRKFCFDALSNSSPMCQSLLPLLERLALLPTNDHICCLEAVLGLRRTQSYVSTGSECMLFRTVQPLLPVSTCADVFNANNNEHSNSASPVQTAMNTEEKRGNSNFELQTDQKQSESCDESIEDYLNDSNSQCDSSSNIEMLDENECKSVEHHKEENVLSSSSSAVIKECLKIDNEEIDEVTDEPTLEEVVKNFHAD